MGYLRWGLYGRVTGAKQGTVGLWAPPAAIEDPRA